MFEPDAESMPAEQRAEVQQERLRTLVDRLLVADGVQGQRLKAAGITGGRDVTLGDLPHLPMTAKDDMWDAYPFGMLTVEREKVVAFHGSSGTGG
jgi:phenylacetate-coenzyme A ligase PaaK-like adenylate-forming protein